MSANDWLSVPFAMVPPKPKAPPIFGGDHRLTGADRQIAKNEPLREWLAKCYAENVAEGPSAWPCFDTKGLQGFLVATQTAVPEAEKGMGRMTAIDLPACLAAPEGCVKNLRGASFLTRDTGSVCDHIHRRRAAARR